VHPLKKELKMGSGTTILGILLIFVAGIAGLYGLAMWVIHGVFPLWETAYSALWLQAEPEIDWFYRTIMELVLVIVLVPLWTWLCAAGVMLGAAMMGDY
jgi:hypothetical protein